MCYVICDAQNCASNVQSKIFEMNELTSQDQTETNFAIADKLLVAHTHRIRDGNKVTLVLEIS